MPLQEAVSLSQPVSLTVPRAAAVKDRLWPSGGAAVATRAVEQATAKVLSFVAIRVADELDRTIAGRGNYTACWPRDDRWSAPRGGVLPREAFEQLHRQGKDFRHMLRLLLDVSGWDASLNSCAPILTPRLQRQLSKPSWPNPCPRCRAACSRSK